MMATTFSVLPSPEQLWWLFSIGLGTSILLITSWICATLMKGRSAAIRHQSWALGVLASLLLPLVAWALPSMTPIALESQALQSIIISAKAISGTSTSELAPIWPTALGIIWGTGTLLLFLRFLRGHISARRRLRSAKMQPLEHWQTELQRASTTLGLKSPISLGHSDAIQSPMALGLLKPVVLLPTTAVQWSQQRIYSVLLHELGHIKRRDTLLQLATQTLCAIHWWNPLPWMAATQLRIEREHACDDLVLRAGVRPSTYAADLLDITRQVCNAQRGNVGAISMADLNGTEERLQHILDSQKPRRPMTSPRRQLARAMTIGLTLSIAAITSPSGCALSSGVSDSSTANLKLGAVYGEGLSPLRVAVDPAYLDSVNTEVNRHMADLQQCYAEQLIENPELSGDVIIHFGISTLGDVVEQCIMEDTVRNEKLRLCVNQLVTSGKYPPAIGDVVDVTLPFSFSPDA